MADHTGGKTMKPTEVDSMNRLRVQAEREVARLKDALREIAGMDPASQRADDLGRAARIARSAIGGVPGTPAIPVAAICERLRFAAENDQTASIILRETMREGARLLESAHGVALPVPAECQHPKAKCVYDSDDGEFERWQCPDCGKRWGVEIPQ